MTMKLITGMMFAAMLFATEKGVAVLAQAQQAAGSYAAMAPLNEYLMADRDAEIALAKSAAPPELAKDATVVVLKKDGYATAVEGKNGFTCIVERSWMSPTDSEQFWNPKMRGPICYNAAAVRSILPYTLERTKLVLSGLTKTEMITKVKAEVAEGKLLKPEAGAMSFMLSKDGYLGDGVGHWHPHLMFHVPSTEAASWGANLEGSPVVLDSDHAQGPEPETIFMVPVGHWSDGSAAESHPH